MQSTTGNILIILTDMLLLLLGTIISCILIPLIDIAEDGYEKTIEKYKNMLLDISSMFKDRSNDGYKHIVKKYKERKLQIVAQEKLIKDLLHEEEKLNKYSKVETKTIRGKRISAQTFYNEMCRQLERDLSKWIYARLYVLEEFKINGILPNVFIKESSKLYLFLCDNGGRFNSRYVKMPKDWPAIGLNAGLLEDLIVVLRTPGQIGLGNKHLYSLTELVEGFRKFLIREVKDPKKTWEMKLSPRFLFLTHIIDSRFTDLSTIEEKYVDELLSDFDTTYKEMELVHIERLITTAILQQGNSKRIGVYKEDGEVFYYAIQGILGDIKFDPRVTKTLDVNNCPPLAVHFTKQQLALNIWNKVPTRVTKQTGRKEALPLGAICKFERPVHALTNVKQHSDGSYRIFNVDKDIRNRMAHGIRVTVERPKYQAGLVIDVPKLIKVLPAGSVKQNEIGTLLVNGDIPNECLLYCISTEEDVEIFWSGIN